MPVFAIIFFILVFIFYFYTRKIDREQARQKVIEEEFKRAEIKRLGLTEEGYQKHLFLKANQERYKAECATKIKIPQTIVLHVNNVLEEFTRRYIYVTYDELNGKQIWETDLLVPLLFNAERIVVFNTFDYKKMLKRFDSFGPFWHFYSSSNQHWTIENLEAKMIRLIDVLNLKDTSCSNIYSLTEQMLDPALIEDLKFKRNKVSREAQSIDRWADGKNTGGAYHWAEKNINRLYSVRDYQETYFQVKAIYDLYKKTSSVN